MNRKNIALYLAALAGFFLLGCLAALGLRAYDEREAAFASLEGGARFELPGFSLRLPDGFSLTAVPQDDAASPPLYDGVAEGEAGTVLLRCWHNERGDAIAEYDEQTLVTAYTNAGYSDVRVRKPGALPFVCYSARMTGGDQPSGLWYAYETWTPRVRLIVETQLSPGQLLPILAAVEPSTVPE